jgi:hypothetical protein
MPPGNAATWQMPLPIWPAPMTPIVLIAIFLTLLF